MKKKKYCWQLSGNYSPLEAVNYKEMNIICLDFAQLALDR